MRNLGQLSNDFNRQQNWVVAAAILSTSVLLAIVLKPILDGEVSSGLIFVFGITLVGATSGLTASLVCALIASAIFNFVVAEPELTFRLSTGEDLAPPIIFTLCAIVSGVLAGRLKDRSFRLGQANFQLESLLETSRRLQMALDATSIENVLKTSVIDKLGFDLALFRMRNGSLSPFNPSTTKSDRLTLAKNVVENDKPILLDGSCVAYRLDGSQACVGAMVVCELNNTQEEQGYLSALSSLVGLTLERAQFAEVIAEAEAVARTEELKSALLSSVSHDLRTPLTTISASASSLIEYGARFDTETANGLLRGIVDECERLNRFTANLLELSRLQSGGSALFGQTLSVTDIVRSVAQRARLRAENREIKVVTPREDVLVEADTVLFDLALTNVLQNAILYSEDSSIILVQADSDANFCTLTITDQGCGIPKEDHQKVFERFYRVKRAESSPQGSGLGLAIAKGFVEAFGGIIEVMSPVMAGKGTSVIIRLPGVTEESQ